MRILEESDVVTVTGAPGVGTSTFFAYFFLRYSAENEDTTVITTSFSRQDKSSVMTAVVVWKGGEMVERTKNPFTLYQLIDKAEKGAGEANSSVIHLCNGRPDFCPGVPMVRFTDPTNSWCQDCPKLFMPLWDLKELQTAANELDRPVQKLSSCIPKAEPEDVRMVVDEVEQRLLMFGGVARECLSDDAGFVHARKVDIERLIGQLNNADYVLRLLEDLEYEMVRYAPHHNNPRRSTITGPPQFAKRLLMAHLSLLDTATRHEIKDCLRASLVYGPVRSVRFELRVHKILSSKCEFTARRLGGSNQPTHRTFKCEKSTPIDHEDRFCYFDEDFSSADLENGPYQVPRATNFATIDSFYYLRARQRKSWFRLPVITLDSTHPVSGESLALLLDRLGLMTMTREHPERVALIFVVPGKIAKGFGRQEIELDVDIPNDEDSVLRLGKIGKMRKKALSDVGIHKIHDLRERLEEVEALRADATTPLAQFLRELLCKHDERQWLKEVLNSIPQFVWPFAH